MGWPTLAFVLLVTLHRPDGEAVHVNPRSVTAVTPARDHGHFSSGARCVIHQGGKFLTVRETCDEVSRVFRRRPA